MSHSLVVSSMTEEVTAMTAESALESLIASQPEKFFAKLDFNA
jgi:hypothetical protein